ncbi:hypothetical protein BX661DRAFT_179756 [Kickxella alabastrina]|uniref:uncharacterized protein n=1 Tax=Kickxella alabastrina TaxID=61397 RepID=UPI002220E3D0|nr:uncharacterized protein BX661DRAFT_179756 [Kickxella alabastrina]KAI7832078.1 hypothetical protein BX661DRAFT_179756 [Kickxella alabastrina]KAJ1946979.1 hypothetical protein GGF37_000795 [Kickxella alabastrina]
MPTFAEEQLAKYGWKQGEGLGKDKAGITRAITVSRRTDNKGIGSESNQWNNNWWDNVYNKAASETNKPIAENKEEAEFQEKIAQAAKEQDTLSEYQGMFVKSAASSMVATPASGLSGVSTPNGPVNRTQLVRNGNVQMGVMISDAELFAACEGRMARKGARADQSGKLARLAGDSMPRPEVVARIEAALSGRLAEQIELANPKRKRSEKDKKEKEREKKDKKDKKDKKKEKREKSKDKESKKSKHSEKSGSDDSTKESKSKKRKTKDIRDEA